MLTSVDRFRHGRQLWELAAKAISAFQISEFQIFCLLNLHCLSGESSYERKNLRAERAEEDYKSHSAFTFVHTYSRGMASVLVSCRHAE
ncbi:hypothetical protein IFT48_17010 [Pseudomonas fluorescens]|uniref:hypothetical protein n=1 Tax=Pseudomonas fluorescens TaxID=294 RepID=UPI0019309F0C|nr:hypothetical protein [Pseudomonas fluorescens]MBD8091695.1 hypothetical protein [Pseudomonas fluorescens]